MRILGIETSSRRGSAALVDSGRLVAEAEYEQLNAHAESMLPLVERLLAEAGWPRSALDRLAVGVGPGSFTGLRVGLALAQGIALGLDRPLVGVGSLRAMAAAAAPEGASEAVSVGALRCPLLDARRDEVFLALYDGTEELAEPRAVGRAEVGRVLAELARGRAVVLLGERSLVPRGELAAFHSAQTDLPHAAWTARLGAGLVADGLPVEPVYVRDAGATLPNLPPSPLG